jgi:hypothetical protein
MGLDRAARSRKPGSGHTGTISTTIRVRQANRNAMKPGSSAFWRSETPDPVRPAGGGHAAWARYERDMSLVHRSEYAGGIVRHWRHLPLRRPAPGGLTT